MAAKKTARGSVNKSQFVRDIVEKNKDASYKDVLAAWQAAGHTGELQATTYYHARGRMGARHANANVVDAPKKSEVQEQTSSRNDAYLAIERTLDGLVSKADDLVIANWSKLFGPHGVVLQPKLID